MSEQNQNSYGSYGLGPGSGQGQFGSVPGGAASQGPAAGAYGQQQGSAGQFAGQQAWAGGQSQMPGFQQGFDAYGNPIPRDARNVASLAHLSGLLGLVVTASFANFIGPLIFWFMYKDRPGYALVRRAAAEAFNFSFTLWLVNIAVWVVNFVTFGLALLFTWVILGVTFLFLVIFHIVAAVKATSGEPFSYPFALKVLS